jgi:hypothetical protein
MSTPETTFCFPIKRLENSRMILLPFDFASHAELFVKGVKKTPDLFSYVSQGPFQTVTDFEAFYKSRILSANTETLFAILAKPTSSNEKGIFAGIIGLQNASSDNATIEIGFVLFPAKQIQYLEGTNEERLQLTTSRSFYFKPSSPTLSATTISHSYQPCQIIFPEQP